MYQSLIPGSFQGLEDKHLSGVPLVALGAEDELLRQLPVRVKVLAGDGSVPFGIFTELDALPDAALALCNLHDHEKDVDPAGWAILGKGESQQGVTYLQAVTLEGPYLQVVTHLKRDLGLNADIRREHYHHHQASRYTHTGQS